MNLKLSALVPIGLVAAYGLSVVPLKHAATAQIEGRGMRVQQSLQTEHRVALVIGNGSYQDSPLLNPVNDARDMAATLRALSFEVIYGENLSKDDTKRDIRLFGDKIRNGGVGLFYYAGHGIQIKGTNYLIPVSAVIRTEEEVEYESVDVGLVLAQMESARNSLNIVILDACRNNPFARSFRSATKGLASMDAPSGTLIAYATAPGSVASDGAARNGLYTQELLKYMRTAQLSIEQVFKQVRIAVRDKTEGKQIPWESSSLVGDFYFLGGDGPSVAKKDSAPVDPTAIELSFWESIKNSTNPEDFKAYLERYPNGSFAALARNRANSKTDKPAGSIMEALRQSDTHLRNQKLTRVSLKVVDSTGLEIPGAEATLVTGGNNYSAKARDDGSVQLDVNCGNQIELRISAPGFNSIGFVCNGGCGGSAVDLGTFSMHPGETTMSVNFNSRKSCGKEKSH